jgi:hypothetical protein
MPLSFRDLPLRVQNSNAVKAYNQNFDKGLYKNTKGAEKIQGTAPIQTHIQSWDFLNQENFDKANARIVKIDKILDDTKKPETDLVKKARALGIDDQIIQEYILANAAKEAELGKLKRSVKEASSVEANVAVTQLHKGTVAVNDTSKNFSEKRNNLTQAINEKEAIKNITLDLASSPDTADKLIPKARGLLFGLQDLDALAYIDINNENLNTLMISSDGKNIDGGEIALALQYNYKLLSDVNGKIKNLNGIDNKLEHVQQIAALEGTKEVIEAQIQTLIKQQVMLGGILMERVVVNETLQNKKSGQPNDPETQKAFDKIENAHQGLMGVDINKKTEFYVKTNNEQAIKALDLHKNLNARKDDHFGGKAQKTYFNEIMLPDFQKKSKLARIAESTKSVNLTVAQWKDETERFINSTTVQKVEQSGIAGCVDLINQANIFMAHSKDRKTSENLAKIITESYKTIKLAFKNDNYQLGDITAEQYASLKEIVETMEGDDRNKINGKDTPAYKEFLENTSIANRILNFSPRSQEELDAFFESLYTIATDEQRKALYALKDITDSYPTTEETYSKQNAVSNLVIQLSSLFPDEEKDTHKQKNRGSALLEAAIVKFVDPTKYNGKPFQKIKEYITTGRTKAGQPKLGIKVETYNEAKGKIYPKSVSYDISKITPKEITGKLFLQVANKGDFIRLLEFESSDFSPITIVTKGSELAIALKNNIDALREQLIKSPSLINHIASASPQLSEMFATQLAMQIVRYGFSNNPELAGRQLTAIQGFINNESIPLKTREAFKYKIAQRALDEETNGIRPSSPIELYRILGISELNDKIIQYENKNSKNISSIENKVEPSINEINKGATIDFNNIANQYSELINEIKNSESLEQRVNLRQARIEMHKQIFQDCMNNPEHIDGYMVKLNVLANLDDNGADFILQLSLVKFYKEIEELRVNPDNTRTINSIKDIVNVPKVNDMKIMLTSLSPEQKFKLCADLAGVLVVSSPNNSNYARLKVLYNLTKMSLEGTEYHKKLENSDFSSLEIYGLDTDSLTLPPDKIITETAKLVQADTPKTTTKRTLRRDDNAPLNRFEKVRIKFQSYQSKFDPNQQALINKLVRKMSENKSVITRESGTDIIQEPKAFTKPLQTNGEISSDDIISILNLDANTDASLIQDISNIENDETLGDIVSTARVIAANKIAESEPTERNIEQLNQIIGDEKQNRKGSMLESDFEKASADALEDLKDHNQIYIIIEKNFSGYEANNIGNDKVKIVSDLSSYILEHYLKTNQDLTLDFNQTDGKISTVTLTNNPELTQQLNTIGKNDPLLLGKIVSTSIVRATMIHYGTGELTHENITKVDKILQQESGNRKAQPNMFGYTKDASTFQTNVKTIQSELKQIPSEMISQTPAGAEVALDSRRTSNASSTGKMGM